MVGGSINPAQSSMNGPRPAGGGVRAPDNAALALSSDTKVCASAPAPIRSLARLMRVAVQTLSITQVKGARGAAHLTDPHVVGPEVCKFVVSSDREWHTRFGLPAAA